MGRMFLSCVSSLNFVHSHAKKSAACNGVASCFDKKHGRHTANNLSFLVSREHRTRSGSSHSRIHDQPRI
jgi:hypothetical protein